MNLEAFIATNPSRADIAAMLCRIANNNCLEIDESYAWAPLAQLGSFTTADFVDDQDATRHEHGDEAVDIYDLKNWRLV